MDSGFIKYHSGGCSACKTSALSATEIDLLWGGTTGLWFLNFFDAMGLVNSSGSGEIMQPWVVNFKPGSFGWTLIS